jgi:hypothetical protein
MVVAFSGFWDKNNCYIVKIMEVIFNGGRMDEINQFFWEGL